MAKIRLVPFLFLDFIDAAKASFPWKLNPCTRWNLTVSYTVYVAASDNAYGNVTVITT